jgi:hypothetical protein
MIGRTYPNPEQPVIQLSGNPEYDEEPALTIGEAFSNAAYIKSLVAAVVVVIGGVAPNLVSGMDQDWQSALSVIIGAIGLIYMVWKAKRVPQDQAAVTRDAVFSPATVQDLIENPGKHPPVVTPPGNAVG